MDKEQTRELLLSLRLVIIGTFFWLIKPKLFTSFFLPSDHFLQIYGTEIIGTILIMIAVMIVYFVFPFTYSLISCLYIIFILILNILDFFLYRNSTYQIIQNYSLFFMSLMLFFVAKLMQEGLRHFGSTELSRKWGSFSLLMFFGFSVPNYLFVTLYNFKLISFPQKGTEHDLLLALIPAIVIVIFSLLYYIYYLIKSLRYLSAIQKRYNEKQLTTGGIPKE